ncbi:MAG: dipeptide ABC transporter ATP-binding protein [Gammaproteobacteria bacterium]|jgi:oligopeptide transport system ATP-binding protein|nr:dipeptide ABC transporter ATP-binding protein [Gammaproteobacteria bacterium]
MSEAPLLRVTDLRVHFPIRGEGMFAKTRYLKAVDGVSFDLAAGETLGVVGESGCGKSTLARGILGLIPVTAGSVIWLGEELAGLTHKEMRKYREEMQIIFQDPLASLNPRMTVGEIIAEPLRVFFPRMPNEERKAKVRDLMKLVGLLPNQINRYPHEFSGGQCQRIGIARALVLDPQLIICDEPVSALDVSIQAQIVNLLMELQRELGLTLIFIAHDLSVVRHISRRVMVMYLGRAVEIADRNDLYENPLHPYTRALISAVPIPDPKKERAKQEQILTGDLPSPLNPPSGCYFRTRCPVARDRCAEETPELRKMGNSFVACHFAGEG